MRSFAVGSGVEVIALLTSIPRDSTPPETGIQLIAAYTQVPGMFAFFRYSDLVQHLPAVIAVPFSLLGLAGAFLIEAGLFALPIWCVARWWRRFDHSGVTGNRTV